MYHSGAALWPLLQEKKAHMRARRHLVASLLTLILAVSVCALDARMSSSVPPTSAVAQMSPSVASSPATSTPIPSGPPGAITGNSLMYPADSIPALTIYALSTTDRHRFVFAQTQPGQLTYKVSNVAPGTYYVIAYLTDGLASNANFKVLSGGYTQEVPRAMAGGINCDNHTLIQVAVLPGVTVTNINPNDSYGGLYPTRPGP
jgi:hypothetical protein